MSFMFVFPHIILFIVENLTAVKTQNQNLMAQEDRFTLNPAQTPDFVSAINTLFQKSASRF